MLGMIQTNKILDSTNNVDLANSFTYYGAYVWEAEENALEIINQKKAEARRRYREKLLNEKKLCVDRAINNLRLAQQDYCRERENFEADYGCEEA